MTEKSSCPVLRGRDDGNIILLLDNLSEVKLRKANLTQARLTETVLQYAILEQITLAGATLERTDLRGIPWLLVMELTLRPDIIWKDVLHDLPSKQGHVTQP